VLNRPTRESDHSPLFSTSVTNESSCTSSTTYAFAECLGRQLHHFLFEAGDSKFLLKGNGHTYKSISKVNTTFFSVPSLLESLCAPEIRCLCILYMPQMAKCVTFWESASEISPQRSRGVNCGLLRRIRSLVRTSASHLDFDQRSLIMLWREEIFTLKTKWNIFDFGF